MKKILFVLFPTGSGMFEFNAGPTLRHALTRKAAALKCRASSLRAMLGRPLMRAVADKLQDRFCYPPRLMDASRAAAYVGFGATKFLELVDEGKMPKPMNIDGSARWDRVELDSAVDNLKDRRLDPVTRDRDRLEKRIRALEGEKAS
jgi:predicted DNA-binding transcriptional regulator AlpA